MPKRKSNEPVLDETPDPDSLKTLVTCLVKDRNRRKTEKKRSKDESDSDSSFEQNPRPALNASDSSGESEEEPGEERPEVDEGEFEDENDLINSDDDDDLSTVNGSVTTFTPTRSSDPYIAHFGLDLTEESLSEEKLTFSKCAIEACQFLSPGFYFQSKLSRFQSGGSAFKLSDAVNLELFPDLRKMKVKQALVIRFNELNAKFIERLPSNVKPILGMTPLQFELFCVLNNYLDLFCPKWTPENADELRLVYCLHVLNHLLKSRKIIALNNSAMKNNKKVEREFRDRGLTRPKCLILVPFRESCSKIVQTLWNLLTDSEHLVVSNRKRFVSEYQLDREEPKTARHFRATPSDFEQLFAGNCDDNFRLGLSISKRTVKIFTDFYASDLIIASPLGLRSIAPRENPTLPKGMASSEEALFDFLSSIEVLLLDQADVLLMQNWDHALAIMQKMNAMPKQPHDVDFSRVRMWSLNGLAKFYRQTVLFSNISLPELNAFATKFSQNRNGRILLSKPVESGSVNEVAHQAPQLFHRIDNCDDLTSAAERRFSYFTTKVLPQIVDSDLRQTLIFVPSYFDYVRLRNYCKREQFNCLWISEYTKDSQVSRVRSLFYHSRIVFMLYTERLHFFKRFRIRGVRNIVFYSLPSYPHFYSEIANWMADAPQGEACQIVALYSRFDLFQLAGIVGSSMAQRMLSAGSDRSVHLFVSGQQEQAEEKNQKHRQQKEK